MKYPIKAVCYGAALLMSILMMATGCSGNKNSSQTSDVPTTSMNTSVTEVTTASSASNSDTAATTSSTESRSSTLKSSGAKTTTTAKTTSTNNPALGKKSEIGFGMYGVQPNGQITPEFYDFVKSDYVNTFLVDGSLDILQETVQYTTGNNSKFWSMVPGLYGVAGLTDNWKVRVDSVIDNIKACKAESNWLGFYLDEPMLWGITNTQLNQITKYMKEKANKRIFICFSIACFYQQKWKPSNKTVEEVNSFGAQYITDMAYDVYEPFHADNFKLYTSKLKEKVARTNVRMWYVPCIMSFGGTTNEDYALKHLKGCFDLLKQEANPGGIMGYTYRAFSTGDDAEIGNKGLSEFITSWKSLDAEIRRIGRSICSKEAFGR